MSVKLSRARSEEQRRKRQYPVVWLLTYPLVTGLNVLWMPLQLDLQSIVPPTAVGLDQSVLGKGPPLQSVLRAERAPRERPRHGTRAACAGHSVLAHFTPSGARVTG